MLKATIMTLNPRHNNESDDDFDDETLKIFVVIVLLINFTFLSFSFIYDSFQYNSQKFKKSCEMCQLMAINRIRSRLQVLTYIHNCTIGRAKHSEHLDYHFLYL